jgi:hypothetical protein
VKATIKGAYQEASFSLVDVVREGNDLYFFGRGSWFKLELGRDNDLSVCFEE